MGQFSLSFYFVFICLCLCFSCQRKETVSAFSGVAMTMEWRVLVGRSLTKAEKKKVQDTVQKVFLHINQIYNKWNKDSELSAFNRLKKMTPFFLSEELSFFLDRTSELVHLTGGLFDPTIEPLQRVWKTSLMEGKIPSEQELRKVEQAVGWECLQKQGRWIWKKRDHLEIDLGGIVKGFAVDLLLKTLANQGFNDLFVEWGGEIRCIGKHPEGRFWRVFISRFGDPDPKTSLAFLNVDHKGLATSGNYYQFWAVEGELYTHVFDPREKKPMKIQKNSIASVTVFSKHCFLADALATAALLFPSLEEVKPWAETIVQKYPDVEFWIFNRETSDPCVVSKGI